MSRIRRPEPPKKPGRDEWTPLRNASGVGHLKKFFDTYVSLLTTMTTQMKKRAMEMGRLGHELGQRHMNAKQGRSNMKQAKEATKKTHEMFSGTEVKMKMPPALAKARKKNG